MTDAPAPYRKFPGRASQVFSMQTLWEGDTHLLLVNSWPSGESYRRFFFADIQAIILRPTNRRRTVNIILGILLLLIGAPLFAAAFQNPDEPGWLIAGGIATGLCLVLLLLNSLRGPACALHVQTALQCERLPSVRRLRRARLILARIQPLITAAQAKPEAAPL